MDENRITYFAETDARNKRVKFGIKAKDRTRHVYVIGKTGMGKSTMLENMAVQDIQNGEGICFIDPHGKTADLLLEYVPKERIRDVIHIAPFDVEFPISFNVLESVDPEKRHLVVSGLMSTFKKIWEDAWSARMEYILTNTLLALLEAKDSTLLGVNRMLSDKEYRKEIVSQIQDPSVRTFWTKEFANYTERMAAEAVPAIQNKVGQFTANPLIRNMIGQPHSSFDFREAIDHRKIIIINLSKGRIGDENMKLLGGLLVTKIYLAAMSRADTPDRVARMLPNFYLFVDEFQNFANASFADILSEARKYKLNLTIAHQYIEQMDDIVRPAVFGNVGTMITFRVGATDAEELEKEFSPQFVIEDLVNLGFTQIYLKLMIDGLTSPPFSAVTLPPIEHPDVSYVKEITDASREQFSRPRAAVEEEIIKFHEPVAKVVAPRLASSASVSSASVSSASNSLPASPAAPAPSRSPVSETRTTIKPTVTSAVKSVVVPTAKPTVKPFTNLKETIAKAQLKPEPLKPLETPVPPAIKAPPPLKPSTPSASEVKPIKAQPVKVEPVKSEPPKIQSVPLSSLAPKPQPLRTDPKARSPKNVADLRSALAAVLGKSGDGPKMGEADTGRESISQAARKPSLPNTKGAAENRQPSRPVSAVVGEVDRALDTRVREAKNYETKEVPEDVLKKVLKVD
jgi:energy-coupling factor transporter ATP-binding protein EcfA2